MLAKRFCCCSICRGGNNDLAVRHSLRVLVSSAVFMPCSLSSGGPGFVLAGAVAVTAQVESESSESQAALAAIKDLVC